VTLLAFAAERRAAARAAALLLVGARRRRCRLISHPPHGAQQQTHRTPQGRECHLCRVAGNTV